MSDRDPAIVVEDLRKTYGRVEAVRGVSFSVGRGEVFGFLGPNGAGKTTAIRCMLDLLRPSSGRISILGLDAHRDALAVHRRLGYVPGDVRLGDDLNGRSWLERYARIQGLSPVLLSTLVERPGASPSPSWCSPTCSRLWAASPIASAGWSGSPRSITLLPPGCSSTTSWCGGILLCWSDWVWC